MKIYTNFTEFLNEKLQVNNLEDFVFEGGAAGHMMHPFDDHSLTFADFKTIVKSSLQGGLDFEEAATEKTDGQNLFATVKDGQAMFARNKGQMINPLDLNGIIKMFTGHASQLVEEACFLSGLHKLVGSDEHAGLLPWRPKQMYKYLQFYNLEPNLIVDITTGFEAKMAAILAHKSQFYNPNSTEPDTVIASKDFLASVEARAMDWGRIIGATYAEPLISVRHIGVESLLDLR